MPFSLATHRSRLNAVKEGVAALTRAKGLNNAVSNTMTAAAISAAVYGDFSGVNPVGLEPTYYDNADPNEMLKVIKEMTEYIAGENSLSFSTGEENTITTHITNIIANGTP